LQPQAAVDVKVGNPDLVVQDVHDVGVIPDALGREGDPDGAQVVVRGVHGGPVVRDRRGANLHSVRAHPTGQHVAIVVGDQIAVAVILVAVVGQAVAADQGTPVVLVERHPVDRAGGASGIGNQLARERIKVDADRHVLVVADDVIQNHRLGAADEHRGPVVNAASVAVRRSLAAGAGGIVFDHTVGDPRLRLMDLDDVEALEGAFDLVVVAAAESDVGVIQAQVA